THLHDALAAAYAVAQANDWMHFINMTVGGAATPWANYLYMQQLRFRDTDLIPVDAAQQPFEDTIAQADKTERDTEADDDAQEQDDAVQAGAATENSDADASYTTSLAGAGAVGGDTAANRPALESWP